MNKLIRNIAIQTDAWCDKNGSVKAAEWEEKFAELIVEEHLRVMNQEWYDLNNTDTSKFDSRDVAINVGRKSEIIVLMQKIRNHFRVEK